MPRLLVIAIVPFSEWPASDQAGWTAALADGGYFGDGGALARYPEGRQVVMQSAYARWLGHLRETNGHVNTMSGLDACRDRRIVGAFLERLRVVAPCTARAYLTDLLTVCRAMAPGDTFAFIHAAARHAWHTAKPVTDKLAKMVPARDLYLLGFELMERAPSLATPLKQASCFRDGLMIATLTACPVRLGNFIAIEIDRHLVFDGASYRLHFAAHEVKNRRPLELPLPRELTAAIDTWIRDFRPECLSRRGRWHRGGATTELWVSEDGNGFSRGYSVRQRIERCTEERFGRRINPHLSRDIAATSIATEIPEQVGIISSVLGHASMTTGECFYNQARSVHASLGYQATIDRFRAAADLGDA